ncbi:hypothetical protein LR48_Vigan04g193600 [Vigna angularis]|uniref:Uncharacterized protein n=1 Tax=Phaseolus angularis TaxID=3914 RepID=A0A0L9UG63_PHAAN|nr:hypothetical protein LR48_Vigan04g193600 [Vigna angularis]
MVWNTRRMKYCLDTEEHMGSLGENLVLGTKDIGENRVLLVKVILEEQVYLDESIQELDSLNSRIQELEAQLCEEDEECKRY